ncbi:alcohol acetyltransferase-domain-containing protein [Xylariales sp. AK1849]|nr:alcohol acetyltransferase-domain-containing protein [Xylariales sp. AK1849]
MSSCFRGDTIPKAGKKRRVVRRLGPIERYQSAQHFAGYYCACAVTYRYAIPSRLGSSASNSELETEVERAVALAVLEHPLLQVGLADEDSKAPSWVRLDYIDFHSCVKWRTVDDSENYDSVMEEILESQHDTRFTDLENLPSWRMSILSSRSSGFIDVVFAYNHAAADGMSGKIFHHTLLEKLHLASSTTLAALEDHVLKLPGTANFTPPLEELLKFPVSAGFAASEGWKSLKPPFLASGSHYSATWAPIRLLPYKTRLLFITIKHETLKSVLEECRRNHTTLTGLLNALALMSFATRLPKEKTRSFTTGTPISLRRFIPLNPPGYPELKPDHTIGNFVAYWPYKFDEGIVAKLRQQIDDNKGISDSTTRLESAMWSVSKAFREKLSKKLETGTKNDSLGLMKLVGDWRSYMVDELKRPRSMSWEVSNLGVVSDIGIPKENPDAQVGWKVDRAIFSQSAAVIGPAICINPIAVDGRDLTVTCTWQGDVVDDKLAQGLAKDLKSWLDTIGDGESIQIG